MLLWTHVYKYLLNAPLQLFGPILKTAESRGNSIFNFLRSHHTVSIAPSVCTILDTHQQYTRVPVSPPSHRAKRTLFRAVIHTWQKTANLSQFILLSFAKTSLNNSQRIRKCYRSSNRSNCSIQQSIWFKSYCVISINSLSQNEYTVFPARKLLPYVHLTWAFWTWVF